MQSLPRRPKHSNARWAAVFLLALSIATARGDDCKEPDPNAAASGTPAEDAPTGVAPEEPLTLHLSDLENRIDQAEQLAGATQQQQEDLQRLFAAEAEFQAMEAEWQQQVQDFGRFFASNGIFHSSLTTINEANAYLSNQAVYTVPLGPINFTYHGAGVGYWTGERIYFDQFTNTTYDIGFGRFWGGGGWNVNRHFSPPELYVKGMLGEVVVPVDTAKAVQCIISTFDLRNYCSASYAIRYVYYAPDGSTVSFFQRPSEAPVWNRVLDCNLNQSADPIPTQYWSADGSASLDISNYLKPVIRWSDGRIEEVHWPVPISSVNSPFSMHQENCSFTALIWPNQVVHSLYSYDTLHVTDRNGNVTTYEYPDAQTIAVTDPRGRKTTLSFSPAQGSSAYGAFTAGGTPRLTKVTYAGPGGVPLTYNLNWVTKTLSFASASSFPDVKCYDQCPSDPTQQCVIPCSTSEIVDLVDTIQIPDGRSYAFTYGDWGNLTQVSEPNGAVVAWTYGNATNTAYGAAANTVAGGNVAGQEAAFQARGVIGRTVYPMGLAKPGFTINSTLSTSTITSPICTGALTGTPRCCGLLWRSDTMPDGTIKKSAICNSDGNNGCGFFNAPYSTTNVTMIGQKIAEETWTAGASAPIASSYFGDTSTGEVYYAADSQATYSSCPSPPLDARPTRVVSKRDSVLTTTTYAYGDAINVGGTVSRNTGNVTAESIWSGSATDGTGTKLVETDTTYLHDANYNARQLLHLMSSVKVLDPSGAAPVAVSSKSVAYDERPLQPSGQPGLDTVYTNAYRGNPTTMTTYLTPATPAGPISSAVSYYDNGAIRSTQNPNDLAAGRFTSLVDSNFGLCPANPAITTTVTNVLSQRVSTVTDCWFGGTLSVLDPNAQLSCSQYDGLGREIETAAPGDTLTNQPSCGSTSTVPAACFVRDPNCLTSGIAIGNGGNGPTTWTEYFPFGLGGVSYNQARHVVHRKDGSASGLYSKTFSDGLGRTIETCAKIDGATSAGAGTNNEICSYLVYDAIGRPFQTFGPFYATSVGVASQPSTVQYAQNCYDALGRLNADGILWGGTWSCGSSPPATSLITTAAWAGSGNTWLKTTTNANGNQSRSVTDVLGRVIETDQYLCATSPCPATTGATQLATKLQYDVLGRLTQATDPSGNVMSFTFDGLGRKTKMHDPDMGDWTYGYDNDGNLTSQTDANGQTITMQYDALDRITLKDLPPAGPDVNDVTYFYDGNLPITCYSCFDPATGTTGTCNQPTATCVGVGGEVGKACVPRTTQSCQDVACNESCSTACTGGSQTCDAAGLGWSTCTGGTCPTPPPTVTCTPGALQSCDDVTCDESCSKPCSFGTTQCNPAGNGWSVCTGGVCPTSPPTISCTPGAVQACDNVVCDESCGSGSCTGATMTCNSTGNGWSACTGGTCPCVPGSTRTVACGACGTETDRCDTTTGTWIAGACLGQGACAPGSTQAVGCGNCGMQTNTCSTTCQWVAGPTCSGQGPCAAGSTRTSACTDAFANAGTETDTCSGACQWVAGVCAVCTPGTSQDCDNGICATCAGTCNFGSQLCQSDGTWGACIGGSCGPITICPPGMICQ